jgi:hypothetical protein
VHNGGRAISRASAMKYHAMLTAESASGSPTAGTTSTQTAERFAEPLEAAQ